MQGETDPVRSPIRSRIQTGNVETGDFERGNRKLGKQETVNRKQEIRMDFQTLHFPNTLYIVFLFPDFSMYHFYKVWLKESCRNGGKESEFFPKGISI